MFEYFDYLLHAATVLLVIIDPVGVVPVFLVVTSGMTLVQQRGTAKLSVVVATIVLIAFALVGERFLNVIGITIHAFRIAGGCLLFFLAYEMALAKRSHASARSDISYTEEDYGKRPLVEHSNVAVFPIAIPLLAGPGAISASIILASDARDYFELLGLIVVIIAIMVFCYLLFAMSYVIQRLMGDTVCVVIERLMGLILSALAIQFIADGIRGLIG